MRKSAFDDALDDMIQTRLPENSRRNDEAFERRLGGPLPGHQAMLPVDRLEADPHQPRKEFPQETLRRLADSIRDRGLLQAILIRPGANGKFLIVAGERRFRAARMAGLAEVPCVLHELGDRDALIIALMENLHREDLTDIDKSDALNELYRMTGDSWEEIAHKVHLSPSRVKSLAEYRKLAPPVQQLLRTGQLSGFRARPLIRLDPPDQVELATRAVTEGLSEPAIRRAASRLKPTPRSKAADLKAADSTKGTLQSTDIDDSDSKEAPNSPVPDVPEVPEVPEVPQVPRLIADLWHTMEEAVRLLRSTGGLAIPEARARTRELMAELDHTLDP